MQNYTYIPNSCKKCFILSVLFIKFGLPAMLCLLMNVLSPEGNVLAIFMTRTYDCKRSIDPLYKKTFKY